MHLRPNTWNAVEFVAWQSLHKTDTCLLRYSSGMGLCAIFESNCAQAAADSVIETAHSGQRAR